MHQKKSIRTGLSLSSMTRHAESSEFLAAAKTEAARAVEHRKKVLEHVGAEAFTVDDFHKEEPGDWKHTTGRSDVTPAELQLGKRCHGAHVETLSADITPAGSHYLLIHFDVPLIDPSAYRLKIHGLVDKEVSLSLADIKRRKAQTASVLMACAGNGRMGLTERFTSHVPWGPDAFGWCLFRIPHCSVPRLTAPSQLTLTRPASPCSHTSHLASSHQRRLDGLLAGGAAAGGRRQRRCGAGHLHGRGQGRRVEHRRLLSPLADGRAGDDGPRYALLADERRGRCCHLTLTLNLTPTLTLPPAGG